MTDGAHTYIGADNALKTILGGEDPEPNVEEPLDFETRVRTIQIDPVEDLGYDGGATATARLILEAYEKYPQLTELSDSNVYLHNGDEEGKIDWNNPIVLNVTLYEVIKKLYPQYYDGLFTALTGFMWGWAVNAARTILDLGPLPNPAIMTFVPPSDEAGGATIDELIDGFDEAIKEAEES